MAQLAIVSIAIGDHYQRLSEITFPTIRRYAEKIGARFIAITEKKIAKRLSGKNSSCSTFSAFMTASSISTQTSLCANAAPISSTSCRKRALAYSTKPRTFLSRRPRIERCAEEYKCRDFKWDEQILQHWRHGPVALPPPALPQAGARDRQLLRDRAISIWRSSGKNRPSMSLTTNLTA